MRVLRARGRPSWSAEFPSALSASSAAGARRCIGRGVRRAAGGYGRGRSGPARPRRVRSRGCAARVRRLIPRPRSRRGLWWLCANLAVAQARFCVVVDDAQWADAPSLRYLSFLVTRLEELSIPRCWRRLVRATRASTRRSCSATLMAARFLCGRRPFSSIERRGRPAPLESALGDVPDPAFRRRLPARDARHAVLGGRGLWWHCAWR